SKEISTTAILVNNRLHFEGQADGNSPISIDYIPPLGDNLGYTSLELLLLSFSTCLGSAVLTLLRRLQKSVPEFEISTKGIRNEAHPTGFKTIFVNIHLSSDTVKEEDLTKVIGLAEEKYCPVWSMVKGNVEVIINYDIKHLDEK
ncbi:MAG: OsmC family peroxiredoxin, partial [Bacteroidales bacterium]|nr:OsmC family peroxiredoxin [Bacteroidales bacterium]